MAHAIQWLATFAGSRRTHSMAYDPRVRWKNRGRTLRLLAMTTGAVLVAAFVYLTWIQPATSPLVVDGWEIGPTETCPPSEVAHTQCEALVERAVAGIKTLASPEIVRVTLHPVERILENGQLVIATFSGGGPDGIVLVEFSNGSRHATAYGCMMQRGPSASPDSLCGPGREPLP